MVSASEPARVLDWAMTFHRNSLWAPARSLAATVLLAALAGCASSNQSEAEYATRGLSSPDRTVAVRVDDPRDETLTRTAALVNGVGVAWSDLLPRMTELAGAAALQETALEMLLTEACARRGISITDDDLTRERQLLIATLADDGIARDDASRDELLGQLLRERRLGTAGFEALLRRTAMSRALVRSEVVLSEAALRRAYELRHGTTYDCRIIVAGSPRAAARVLDRLRGGEAFADVAAQESTDASAASGGRVPPINPADLSWPAAIRDGVRGLSPGQLSAILPVENGYAVVRLERVNEPVGAPTFESARATAERDARLEAERLLMARLARDLLASADINPMQPALRRAYELAPRP